MGLATRLASLLGAGPIPLGRKVAGAREEKSAGAPLYGGAFLLTGPGGEGRVARSFEAMARTGFMGNPVAYRCVRMISQAAGAIPPVLLKEGRELSDHPVLRLLARPNAGEDRASLVETLCGYLLLSGDAYLEAAAPDGAVAALYGLRPDRVRAIAGRDGWPEAYEYRVGSSVRRFSAEGDDGRLAQLLHLRLFHPLSDQQGFAPMAAAAAAVDLHNAAADWNAALLKNSARPSGALVYQPADGANLSPEQFDRLKAELETGYAGAGAAGRPMLLEGGLDWKAMALSPKDMDFMEARHGAARDIALAFGVPPMLLGIPGDLTYANYAEANRAFYRLTVLPMIGRVMGALGTWLGGHFGDDGLELGVDLDAVEGLSVEREALWARIAGADFLTRDEKRLAVGYGREG
ncbi:phage portal protein [Fulvimarina endophytica]|uniref:Phage portal protein n=1 Tax=Fulvimarina endophytica TaxID=2293836 RepID=A0A371X4T8_9HYPH|nr:phage portal protein [Fulvimarina endophytica]RFC64217.1 phage portal protein [Fulvimarina endophytica]